PPVTTSRDEWAGSFRDLSQLFVEGLEKRCLAGILRSVGVAFENQFGSIKLAELLWHHAEPDDGEQRFSALRECVEIRNKTGAHAAPADASRLASEALEKHESFMAHFEEACHLIAEELRVIEALCRKYHQDGQWPALCTLAVAMSGYRALGDGLCCRGHGVSRARGAAQFWVSGSGVSVSG
ncbi:hypothetical protein, partial [Salibaculum halophilum]|uniref:hypothetical protein n=1 Tax=Salibaculum halophilum TaxID=1914408 RepID=UPI001C4EB1DE